MLHQISCGLLLLGLIVQVTLCGSSGIVSRMLFEQDHTIVHPNCLKPPGGYRIQYKCPPGRHVHGQVCQMTCVEGYQLSESPASITCLEGLWKYSAAKCVHVVSECQSPQLVSHGVYHCTSKTHDIGAVCNLICDQGYQPESPKTITCQTTATWSTASVCVPTTCPAPPHIVQGRYHCKFTHGLTTHKQNDVCQLHCHKGYSPSSSHSDITCLSTWRWSAPASCGEVACPAVPNVTHGWYSCPSSHGSRTHKLNVVCTLHCYNAYRPSTTDSDIKCLSTGLWSTPASCHEIKCPAPPSVTFGKYTCASSTTHKLNDTCHLHCSTGYKPNNPGSNITCLSSEKWSTPNSCIEKTCSQPPTVANGRYECSAHRVNDTCQLNCLFGYKPSIIDTNIKCLSTGKWSTTSATCNEIQCPIPATVSHGSFHCSSSVHKPGSVCSLTCDTGYTPSGSNTGIVCSLSSTWSSSPTCEVTPRECEICSGSLCESIGAVHLQLCPGSKPYCMNHVNNSIAGTMSVSKSCGSEADCNSKWWHGTSDRTECTDFDPARPHKRDFSCFYCCTVSGCNKGIVPDSQKMFIGHD